MAALAPQASAWPAATQQACSGGRATSSSSSGSRFSETCAVEQPAPWPGLPWPAHTAAPAAQSGTLGGGPGQGLAAAAAWGQPGQLTAPCAGSSGVLASIEVSATGWHHGSWRQLDGSLGSSGSFASGRLPAAASAAAAGADGAAAPDPWQSGLDALLAGEAAPAGAGGALPFAELDDGGLEALLGPLDDWGCLLPGGPAAGAGPLPELAPLSSGTVAPAAAQQQQQREQLGQQGQPGTPSPEATASCPPRGSSQADAAAAHGKAPRRRAAGRPRAAAAPPQPAAQQPPRKSGRGPKPKYVFGSAEEAADARRERNRKAALESYYKKKEHTQRLQAQIAALQAENGALQRLLAGMAATGLCPLPEASDDGINAWLKLQVDVPSSGGSA